MTTYKKYWLLSLLGVLAASGYPLYMGVKVLADYLQFGVVAQANYPKYIIPYTPISLAVIGGVLLLPAAIRFIRRFSLPAVSAVAVGLFFLVEYLLENVLIATDTGTTALESWQMYMCYVPQTYKVTTAVEILMGEYSPAFKLHFYVISIVLILAALNCFHGFGVMLRSGDTGRKKPLILQTVATVLFLGLCIFACFTAFYRTGELQVSALSAVLMWVFFVVFGVTMGIYAGSFLMGRGKWLSVGLPSFVASAVTLVMYFGEMILLNGNVYRFGEGFLFDGLGVLVLAPVDILVILTSGLLTAAAVKAVSGKTR